MWRSGLITICGVGRGAARFRSTLVFRQKDSGVHMEERTQHRTNVPTRLRFVLGDKAVDVALPGDVQLVDLLPSILAQFGKEWIEQSVDHEGWVAQRLGEAVLDEDKSPVELQLLDGDVVHLRPRGEEFAPLDFDDLVDGLAERARGDAGRWTPDRSRWMLRAGAAFTLLTGLLAFFAGPGTTSFWLVPAVLALAFVIGAAGVARTVGDPVNATALALVGILYATAAGWLLARWLDPVGELGVPICCALAMAVVATVLAAVSVADSALIFTAGLVFGVLTLIPSVIWTWSDLTAQQSVAIGIMVNFVASLFVPGTAFRLGRLRLPMLPTEAAEVKEDTEPVPHQVVIERSAVVFGYLKALYLGFGAAQVLLLISLNVRGGQWPLIFGAVCAALMFLRSRHLSGVVPRWSLLVPAAVAVATIVLRLAFGQDPLDRVLAVLTPLVLFGAALVVLTPVLPGKRMRPYWGRAVDILEHATAVAVVPLLLAVLDVYTWVRGLSG
jgi:ESX secretion system protein EccD